MAPRGTKVDSPHFISLFLGLCNWLIKGGLSTLNSHLFSFNYRQLHVSFKLTLSLESLPPKSSSTNRLA